MPKYYVALALLALVTAGCQQTSTQSAPITTVSSSAQDADAAVVQGIPVTLQLPNMVCGGCAAEVEKGLKSVVGIEGIKTDFTTHVCKFVVTDDTLDWKAKLAELAKDNSHLEDWSVVSAPGEEASAEKGT